MSLSSLDLLSEGLFAAPDDEVLTAFIGMVRASAREATPAERMLVADRLHDLAIQRGLDALVGEDAIQNEIAQAFDESGLNDKVQDDWGEPKSNGHDTQLRLIQSSAEFIKDFQPPDYLIDGILQRRFLYAFTGKTGSGKTAIVLHWAAMVALGRKIGEIETQQGRVVYFAGENPDDVRMRWIAMSQQFSFDANAIPVYFIPGRFKISEMRLRIIEETLKIG